MPEIKDGESVEMQGSAATPYILTNTGGVLSCTCPAWRNQSVPIERRTCKHLRKYCGEDAEKERLGGEIPERASVLRRAKSSTSVENGEADDGEEQSGPPLLLAHSWTNDIDLTGWWMSEKLDGVRAYWDGKRFISRQGNTYMAPDWFIEDLPGDVHLDGELWLSRKAFQRAVSIVRRQDKNDQWREMTFLVFDAPQLDDAFEARIAYLHQSLGELQPKYARPHEHQRCQGLGHLQEELARVEKLGGEGLMLRKPGSRYEVGRSSTLLKVKSFHDADARVVEHLPGTGRHKGRLGALSVQLDDGTQFSVGTGFSDHERDHPPPVGSIITFRYQELSDRGVPRFPSFVRLRTDVSKLSSNLESNPPVLQGAVLSVSAASTSESVPGQVALSARSSIAPSSSAMPATPAAPTAQAPPAMPIVSAAPAMQRAKAPPTQAQASSTTTRPGGVRCFQFVEGSSSKFWQIAREDKVVSVKFGRIGTAGHAKDKEFPSAAEASKYYDQLVAEKTGKGYVEKDPMV
jgi:DNA ligase-1